MTIFTQPQVQALAVEAGFPTTGTPSPARIAGAIAMVESQSIIGGKNYADSDRVGDQHLVDDVWWYSYGLWQVRSLRADKGTGRTRDQLRLPDPQFNAAAAYRIWLDAGRKFTPWSTFNSEAYTAYLQDVFPPPPSTYVVIGGDTLTKIAAKISKLTGWPIDWHDLAAVNHLGAPYTIYPGNHLVYPWTEHTVVSGESLSGITAKYGSGVTWQQVAAFNGITNPNLIRVDQVIRIPRPEVVS